MELLDDIEAIPVKAKTFRKEISITFAEDEPLEDTQGIDQESEDDHPPSVLRALDLKQSSVLNISPEVTSSDLKNPSSIDARPAPPSIKNLFGSASSILDRVKRRLNGEVIAQETTQPNGSATASSDLVESSSGTQTATATQSLEAEAQTQAATDAETQLIEQDTQPIHLYHKSQDSSELDDRVSSFPHIHDDGEESYAETQTVAADFGSEAATQAIGGTEIEAAVTQTIDQDQDHLSELSFEGPPKRKNIILDDEDDDIPIENPDEEAPIPKSYKNLFLSDSEDEDTQKLSSQMSPDELVKSQRDERLKKISELAAKKKAIRLLKEQQERDKSNKDLEAKTHGGDEDGGSDGGDEQGYASADDQIDQYNLVAPTRTIKVFKKASLFAAFGVQANGKIDENDLLISEANEETPNTSPQKEEDKDVKPQINLSDSESDDNFEIQDHFKQAESKKHLGPPSFSLSAKGEKKEELQVVELDDDSDSDIEIGYSKAAILDFKTMLSRKKAEKKSAPKTKNPAFMSKKQLFQELKQATKRQLKQEQMLNPEIPRNKEMLQQESLNVEDLLQRHIEQNNRIREKEREMEKWRRDTANNMDSEDDDDYDEDGEEHVEVPDSDFVDEDSASDDEEQEDYINSKKSRRKQVIAEDDDDDEEDGKDNEPSNDQEEIDSKLAKESDSHISLGVFGGNLTQSFESTQKIKDMFGVSMTQLYEDGSQSKSPKVIGSNDIFDKLRKTNAKVIGEESFESSTKSVSLNQMNQGIDFPVQETQPDDMDPSSASFSEPSQAVTSNQIEQTAIDGQESKTNHDSENDYGDEVPRKTRRLTKKRVGDSESSGSDEESDDEEEETEEQKLQRILEIEAMKVKRRELEKEQKQKKKEMKAKGLDKVMEAEAEESEDEWHGIGGVDGEGSDEENSEDEKMLDDYSKIKTNRSELAARLAQENAEADDKMVARLVTDLERGRLGRRGKADGEDLDFSDGEDEVMRSYRIYNQLKLKEKLEQDEALRQLAKDKRSKAFFESITENSLDSRNEIFNAQESDDSDDNDDDSNPFQDASKKDEFKDPSTFTKKKKITERFVQKTLSFISNPDEEYEPVRRRRMSDFGSDDFNDDLSTLKQNSVIQIPDKTPQKRKIIDLENDNETSPSNFFKKPSLISKSFQRLDRDSFSNNNEVTISTSYKTASSSKSSVMSFGKRSLVEKKTSAISSSTSTKIASLQESHRVLKARKVSKIVQNANRLKSFDGFTEFE